MMTHCARLVELVYEANWQSTHAVAKSWACNKRTAMNWETPVVVWPRQISR